MAWVLQRVSLYYNNNNNVFRCNTIITCCCNYLAQSLLNLLWVSEDFNNAFNIHLCWEKYFTSDNTVLQFQSHSIMKPMLTAAKNIINVLSFTMILFIIKISIGDSLATLFSNVEIKWVMYGRTFFQKIWLFLVWLT